MKIVFSEYRRSSLSFLLMALMVTTSFVVLASGHASAEAVDETGTALDEALPGADPTTKIDPDLLLRMKGSDGPFTVNLVVTDRAAVNKVLFDNGMNELKGIRVPGDADDEDDGPHIGPDNGPGFQLGHLQDSALCRARGREDLCRTT